MQPVTPARLSTREIVNFESVKFLRKSGIAAELNPQKKWVPNHPTPRTIILAGLILGISLKGTFPRLGLYDWPVLNFLEWQRKALPVITLSNRN